MTCTGCETKLRRTLGTHEAVKNLKTSLVLARAEFDLEVGRMSVEDAIKFLERTTEFKCERVSNRGSRLDFIVTGDATTYAKGPWPDGVTEISSYGKNVIRVEFDAKVIGARDLKERGWPTPMKLAPPRPDPSLDAGSKHVRHMGYMTILSALLTIPVLVMAWAPLPERDIAYGSASLALATIVQIVIAGPFYPKALKGLIFSRMIEMDLLIVLSTSAAYIFSVVSFGCLVAGRPLSTGEFFETSTLLVTLIMVGRYVAALARQKAVESISIRSLQTTTATLINGDETEIDARLLQYGDTFKILPESRIPTDGTVIDGESETNESMITGESRPVNKSIGSNVIAGSINGSGTLTVRLTRLPGDNTISTIAGMVDEAKLSKPKIQDIADKVASYFVPGVVTLTIITFTVWIAIGVAVRGQSGNQAAVHAITYAITVLIVSCPCAIGLAVPMVIVIASGVAAERGVIFKSATSIELAHKATDIVFDKTGTLTEGELSVVSEQHFGIPETLATNQALLLGLIGSNKHPISLAIATHLRSKNISPLPITNIQTIPSKGLQGTHSTSLLRAGSSTWLNLPPSPSPPSSLPTTTLHFTLNLSPTPTLTYTLHTPLRPSASPTLSSLLSKNITPHLLSGDTPASVHAIASLLRIPASNIRASCTPAQKREYVRDLQSRHPHRVVLFCGDGTNDAPALAQAHVGIHVPCIAGADVARGAADVVLLSPGLEGVVTVVRVSRGAMRRVWFNFGWSFVYNVVAVVVGSGALVRARLEPAYAGLGEVVSVLPVVGVAVGMRWGGV
ncbi:heavy metal translocatin [Polyplosphaeria fusca]|uniref:Heavy metal translocatin n=1 Tax=Polyplosphaeria fusca TaxID=682080 RepID=A0A9P4QJV8_9PLEO|nr:heavy metal translocatin [Polyplosphaeria fusca]